jgi:hypothetical protein
VILLIARSPGSLGVFEPLAIMTSAISKLASVPDIVDSAIQPDVLAGIPIGQVLVLVQAELEGSATILQLQNPLYSKVHVRFPAWIR